MPRSTALLVLASVAVLAVPSRGRAGGPDLGPSAAELAQARTLAAMFRRVDGIERAMRALCRDEEGPGVQRDTAFTVLVARAAAAMPRLLDAIAAGDAPNATGERVQCSQTAYRAAGMAVCVGHNDADLYEVDHRSEASIQQGRGAAQRALVAALGKPGARRRAAIDVLQSPPDHESQWCDDANLLRLATPSLVKMLAAKDQESEVLALFGRGGDPRIAAPAIRPYLADRKRVPLAALALAHLGEDMSSSVAQLAEALGGPDVEIALEALRTIGPGAHGALSNLVALSKRLDATCGKPVRADRLAAAVAAIATRPEDARVALDALVPLLSSCPAALRETAEAIAMLGGDGIRVLLTYLHDDDRTASGRLWIARALRGHAQLDSADQAVVRLLEARDARFDYPAAAAQVPGPMPTPDPLAVASETVTACRAEAGLAPIAVTGISAAQAGQVTSCLGSYLCGPSRRSLVRTLDRCCGPVFGAQRPAFCRP